jgi:hypothetical protein
VVANSYDSSSSAILLKPDKYPGQSPSNGPNSALAFYPVRILGAVWPERGGTNQRPVITSPESANQESKNGSSPRGASPCQVSKKTVT